MLFAEIGFNEAAILLVGTGAGYVLSRLIETSERTAAAQQRQALLDKARDEAESLTRRARQENEEAGRRLRTETEAGYTARQQQICAGEQRLAQRELLVNHQLEGLVRQEKNLQEQRLLAEKYEAETTVQRQELTTLIGKHRELLQKAAHLSEAEARTQFLKAVEQDALGDANDLTCHILENAKCRAEAEARRIVSLAIQRYASDTTFDTTTATIALEGDEIKGRIIGREGRNIRAFEAATGVTVLIDDTPNAVVLSGFDPVRREIAREAMARLILDGRIHPTRIEEVVTKVAQEIDETIVKAGEAAVFRAGLPPLHQEIVKLLGKLRFRQSFSQNILDHSVEVAQLVGLMAAELGLDVAAGKRAGLLHDIGKALNHEVEGAHAIVGANFIQRFGEAPDIVNGVASHHDEVPHTCLWGILVSAADAISASRPGARSETMTTYLKRLENLEKIGLSFAGVEKCFAVQAGRELRVVVRPEQITDEQAVALARNLTRKIEDELNYPGQIRVTVIRETRVVEYAK